MKKKQKEHHKEKDFKTEFRSFLKKYEVEYDKQFVWDRRLAAAHFQRPVGLMHKFLWFHQTPRSGAVCRHWSPMKDEVSALSLFL